MGSVVVTVREVGSLEVETHKECVRIALEHQTRIDEYSLPCELTEERVWMESLEGATILLAEMDGVTVGVARISSLPHGDASEAEALARDHAEVGKYAYLFIANRCEDADRKAVLKALIDAAVVMQSAERDGKRSLCVSLSSVAADSSAIELLGRMGAVELERGEDWFWLGDSESDWEDPLSDESGPDDWFGTPISVRKVDASADWHERSLAALAFAAMTSPGSPKSPGLVNDMAEWIRGVIDNEAVYFASYDGFEEEWGYLGGVAVSNWLGSILAPTLSNASECTTAAMIAHLLRAAGYPLFHIEVCGFTPTILRVAGALGYSAVWYDHAHISFVHRVGDADLDQANAVALELANESIDDADQDTASKPGSDWDCIPTGIEELDWVTGGGLSRGKMFLVGSRDKSDATQLAKRIAASAKDRGLKVLYQAGWLTDQYGRKCDFEEWVERLGRLRDRGELDFVVIDNLQCMVPCPDGVSLCTWAKELAMKTKVEIAMGLGLPVLLLARLRDLEDKKIVPSNKSWEWSTRIVDHADVAMIAHRPKRGELNLILTKNRAGEVRTIALNRDTVSVQA